MRVSGTMMKHTGSKTGRRSPPVKRKRGGMERIDPNGAVRKRGGQMGSWSCWAGRHKRRLFRLARKRAIKVLWEMPWGRLREYAKGNPGRQCGGRCCGQDKGRRAAERRRKRRRRRGDHVHAKRSAQRICLFGASAVNCLLAGRGRGRATDQGPGRRPLPFAWGLLPCLFGHLAAAAPAGATRNLVRAQLCITPPPPPAGTTTSSSSSSRHHHHHQQQQQAAAAPTTTTSVPANQQQQLVAPGATPGAPGQCGAGRGVMRREDDRDWRDWRDWPAGGCGSRVRRLGTRAFHHRTQPPLDSSGREKTWGQATTRTKRRHSQELERKKGGGGKGGSDVSFPVPEH